jgi:hypothetical protein
MRKCQIDSFGKGLKEMAGSCELGCESFGSLNNGDFFESLKHSQLLKIECSPRGGHLSLGPFSHSSV